MRRNFWIKVVILGLIIFYYPPYSLEAIIAEYLKDNITPVSAIYQFNNQITLNRPVDIYIDNEGNLYVLDLYHQAVFVYDAQHQPLSRLDISSGLKKPVAVAVDRKGNIYISDAERGILVFNSIGKIIKIIELDKVTEGKVRYATDLMLDKSNRLYLVTGTEMGVLVLNEQDKLEKRIIIKDIIPKNKEIMPGEIGKEMLMEAEEAVEELPESPVSITQMSIDANGKIYLVSEEMGRIYVYGDPDTFLFKFGQKGGSLGKLSRPVGIAVDCSHGFIYLVDYMRHNISIYNLNGVFLQEYGGNGKAPGWFNHPNRICLDNQQQLVVADTFNHRIQILALRTR